MSLVMGRLPLRRDHRVAVVDRNGEAGLRTSGSTPALPAFPTRWGQWLRVSRVGGCSPVTAAGPCRIHTGFPILPTISGAPRKRCAGPDATNRPVAVGIGNWIWQFQPRVRVVDRRGLRRPVIAGRA